jgi:polyhydroxyalkanoate synthesis regulator phasin
MVVTEVRKYVEAAVEKLTPAKAQEMARSLLQGQDQRREQVQKVAQELMDWSNQTRERMSELVRREVARQLKTMGVASKEDLESLRARVRDLERSGRARPVKTPAKAAGKTGAKAAASPASPASRTAASAGRRTATAAPSSPPADKGPS